MRSSCTRNEICEAAREPVERDTLYRRVVREGKEWSVAPAAQFA